MVLVTWNQETGDLTSVEKGDGPGEFTDDVPVEIVEERLRELGDISKELIAGVLMENYRGPLSEYDCHVSVSSFKSHVESRTDELPDGTNPDVTAIAFIELNHMPDKLSQLSCENCRESQTQTEPWDFEIRESSGWTYHDWRCPSCGDLVHVELVQTSPAKLAEVEPSDNQFQTETEYHRS